MDNDYLGRRLERTRADALAEAQKQVNRVQSELAGMGRSGRRSSPQCEQVVTEVLAKALQRMAKTAFNFSGSTSDAAARQLERPGTS